MQEQHQEKKTQQQGQQHEGQPSVMVSKVVPARSGGVAKGVIASDRVAQTSAMFGLGLSPQQSFTIVSLVEIPLPPGAIVFVTGPSGGGKSSILSLTAAKAAEAGHVVVQASDLGSMRADACVIDLIGDDLERGMGLLSLVGLADAFVMLRRWEELSDGQRSRLMLARLLARADELTSLDGASGDEADRLSAVIVVDEFASTLDRLTAKVIARNVRRRIGKRGCRHTFVCATTHDDLLESLRPDVVVWKGLRGEDVQVVMRSNRPREEAQMSS